MTPYRISACAETDDSNGEIACTEGPFGLAGCPTCGACIERVRTEAWRAARRSRWTAALGALAAFALLMTTLASFRVLAVADAALDRLDRRESRRSSRDLSVVAGVLRDAVRAPKPPGPRHHHHHHHAPPGSPTVVKPAPVAQPAFPVVQPAPPVAVMAYGLDSLGAPTHDPLELRRRAERLGQLGLGVPVFHAHVSSSALTALLLKDPHALVLTPEKIGELTVGVRITGVTPGLAATGLRNGDVLTSANGLSLKNAADLDVAFAASKQTSPHVAIVELLRGGRPAILDVALSD